MMRYFFRFLLVLNLCLESDARIHIHSRAPNKSTSTILKEPPTVSGSDDGEVFHPFIEKDHFLMNHSKRSTNSTSSKSTNIKRHRKSKISKGSGQSSIGDDSKLLKMNLDLPSIQSNSQSIFKPFYALEKKPEIIASSSSSKIAHAAQDDCPFKIPSSGEKLDDNIVIFKMNTSDGIASGLATGATSNVGISPGTVIASPESSYSSSKLVTMIPSPGSAPGNNQLLQGASSDENMAPLTNRIPAVPFPKGKRIKSLDDETIEALEYDPSYTGPKINMGTNVTTDFVSSTLIPFFKSGKILDKKSAYSVRH